MGQVADPIGNTTQEDRAVRRTLLSDRHLVLIAEEKSFRRFGFRRDAKYGGIITHIPRRRLARHETTEQRRARKLTLELCLGDLVD